MINKFPKILKIKKLKKHKMDKLINLVSIWNKMSWLIKKTQLKTLQAKWKANRKEIEWEG